MITDLNQSFTLGSLESKIKKVNKRVNVSLAQLQIQKFEKASSEGDRIFFQAMEEVLDSIAPLIESDERYRRHAIVERLTVPDRVFKFKVTWLDDANNIQVNTGYRVQFNNSLGPYKGGFAFTRASTREF